MPELPEVELVARSLDRLVAGRQITSARLLRARLAPETTPRTFSRRLNGARIERVGRRGKHILFELDAGRVLIAHLRMTGRFLLLPPERPLPAHTHALFQLDDARRLVFSDQRHFGMMKLVAREELDAAKELRALAPEPFSADFTVEYLRDALARSRRALKETLLDQTKVTGLGNIYAAEALLVARVSPFVASNRLSPRRVARLREAILEILSDSIAHGSTMNVDPEDIDGSYYGGAFEGRWRVYDREGEPCVYCRARVRRVTHAGRSTYFCPRCQRK
ncbi:MAG TPA: bifunctional DNA-formamidopyrimidine glycosylase/DNA-(apurinic or apyrimidinic site) lyase [Pyrinomonadaceae bacterium]|nr:bifunctional DNA-formamidopyrimidine glycosylase/DNA-(apurinic or apyrimidinic site) lyase [Pyrinomonadaceae bacterium]